MPVNKIVVPDREPGSMEHPATANKITIRGTIVSSRPMRNAISLIVATDAGSGISRTNYPNVTFRNKDICRGFLVGDRVTVTCRARIQTRRNRDTGKYEFPRELLGDSLEFTNRALADYIVLEGGEKENGGSPDDMNAGIIAGRLTDIYVPENNRNISIITLETASGRREERIEISCFDRQAHTSQKMKKGDWCIAAVSVRTLDQEKFEDKNYNTIICKDIYIVNMSETDEGKEKEEAASTEAPVSQAVPEEPAINPESETDSNSRMEESIPSEGNDSDSGFQDSEYGPAPYQHPHPDYPGGYNPHVPGNAEQNNSEPSNAAPPQDNGSNSGTGWGRKFRW